MTVAALGTRTVNTRFMEAARTQLGEAARSAAVATGRALSLDQAIASALEN